MMYYLPPVASGAPLLDTVHHCDALQLLRALPDGCIQCVITSPPYFGLRSYLDNDDPNKPIEIGLEADPKLYVSRLVAVFREARRALADDGLLWLNLGDSYSGGGGFWENAPSTRNSLSGQYGLQGALRKQNRQAANGFKPKDLMMIPARVAIALQDDGWWLRSEIVWHKPNPMPESVQDRPTKAHEMIYMLAKNERYFYDYEAILEPSVRPGDVQVFGGQKSKIMSFDEDDPNYRNGHEQWGRTHEQSDMRNKRSVWRVPNQPFPAAHFAVFPEKLIEPMILAGSRPGDVVLDPFMGSGTTAVVAHRHGRKYLGSELNADYIQIARERLSTVTQDMFTSRGIAV